MAVWPGYGFGELILANKTWVSDGRKIRVYAVGKSGDGAVVLGTSGGSGGGSGGIACSELTLPAGTQVACTVSATQTLFGSYLKATAGESPVTLTPQDPGGGHNATYIGGKGGVASGGNVGNAAGFQGGNGGSGGIAAYDDRSAGLRGGNNGMLGGALGIENPDYTEGGGGGGGGAKYGGENFCPYVIANLSAYQAPQGAHGQQNPDSDSDDYWYRNVPDPILGTPYPTPVANASLVIHGGGGGQGGYSSNSVRHETGAPRTLGTPGMIIIEYILPTIPPSISIPSLIYAGYAISVSWSASTPSGSSYRVERSINGGTWTQEYSGTSLSFSNLVPIGTARVQYRVCAFDKSGNSAWRNSVVQTVQANVAPITPPSITLPTEIRGGVAHTVSWSASSDANGNLSGYRLERSINGGAWALVSQGTETVRSVSAPYGTITVKYRVQSYDALGLSSSWKESENRSVVNNLPPAAPPGIFVPEQIRGGEPLTVEWVASIDPESNLAGYVLEKNTGSGWLQIYKGMDTFFSDTVAKGTVTVRYRVLATDTLGDQSDYTTSPVRTVDNNTAPIIATDGISGIINEDFSVSYTVTDEEGDTVTITESVDGVPLRSFQAASDSQNALEIAGVSFMQLLNGPHELEITAVDPQQRQSKCNLAFTKEVHGCSISLARPMVVTTPIAKMVMNIVRNVPADAVLRVLVTNNALDASPVWEDATDQVLNGSNYFFANKTAVRPAFNFQITAERGPSGEGGSILNIGGAFEAGGTPDTPSISVTLTNRVVNGDFSSGNTGVTLNGGELTVNGDGTGTFTYVGTAENRTYFFPNMVITSIPDDHIAYIRLKARSEMMVNGAPSTSYRMSAQSITSGGTVTGITIPFTAPNPDDLELLSGYGPIKYSTRVQLTMTRTGGVNMYGSSITVGEVLAIDLTEAYGAGNEPAKEWCDENIPFFMGSVHEANGTFSVDATFFVLKRDKSGHRLNGDPTYYTNVGNGTITSPEKYISDNAATVREHVVTSPNTSSISLTDGESIVWYRMQYNTGTKRWWVYGEIKESTLP